MVLIYRHSDDPNMFVVTGDLLRDPAIIVYVDSGQTHVYDDHMDLGKSLKIVGLRRLEEINGLTFLTLIGENVNAFYNRLIDNPGETKE